MQYRAILGIDPGTCQGWAWLVDGELVAAGIGNPLPALDCRPVLVAIEKPTIYPHGKADPRDVVELAIKAGELAGFYREQLGYTVHMVEPRTWKGQVPKHIHHQRIKAQLTSSELAVVPKLPPSKAHNMWDAIGLALWAKQHLQST